MMENSNESSTEEVVNKSKELSKLEEALKKNKRLSEIESSVSGESLKCVETSVEISSVDDSFSAKDFSSEKDSTTENESDQKKEKSMEQKTTSSCDDSSCPLRTLISSASEESNMFRLCKLHPKRKDPLEDVEPTRAGTSGDKSTGNEPTRPKLPDQSQQASYYGSRAALRSASQEASRPARIYSGPNYRYMENPNERHFGSTSSGLSASQGFGQPARIHTGPSYRYMEQYPFESYYRSTSMGLCAVHGYGRPGSITTERGYRYVVNTKSYQNQQSFASHAFYRPTTFEVREPRRRRSPSREVECVGCWPKGYTIYILIGPNASYIRPSLTFNFSSNFAHRSK